MERLEFRAQSLSELVLVRGTRTQARIDALIEPLTRFPRQFAAIPGRPGTVSYPMGASKVRVVAHGEDCSDIHYVESGLVKLALVSKRGKSAVLGILGQGDFFEETCIGGDTVYSTSAIALVPTCISVMPGRAMLRTLKEDSAFAIQFMNDLLTRNRHIEQDLIDHMLHFSEKRLARTLISLAQSRNNGQMASLLENIGQDTLADMIGTTRSRVNFFMNKFRKSGHIHDR